MRKQVMVKAWEITKKAVAELGGTCKLYFREALKIAWAEVKAMANSVKAQMVETMKDLIEMAVKCYDYEIVTKEWNNYGRSRCYLSIVETRDNSRHYVKYDCGYVDNNTDTYVAGKVDLTKRFALSGARY